jgi:hypothetical protein
MEVFFMLEEDGSSSLGVLKPQIIVIMTLVKAIIYV